MKTSNQNPFNVFITSIVISLIFFACSNSTSDQSSNTNEYIISHALDFPQESKAVSLSVEELEKKFGANTENQVWIPCDQNGQLIPFQYDDLDEDGTVDELFFVVNLKANEEMKCYFKAGKDTFNFAPQTNIHLGLITKEGIKVQNKMKRLTNWTNTITQKTFQFEGPGWENDKVAFRNYLDMRNGNDIFGKTTQKMVLDSVGAKEGSNYHELADWGMDILKVGSSLGAGSMALMYKDSLIRLTAEDADFRIIKEGPLRSIIEFNFQNIDLGDKKINASNRISIQKGKYYYESSLDLSDSEGIKVLAGIVNLHEARGELMEVNNHKILYTFNQQSENNDQLGMAIQVADSVYLQHVATDTISEQIPDTYAIVMPPTQVRYRFYACWELSDPRFKSLDGFQSFLEEETQKN